MPWRSMRSAKSRAALGASSVRLPTRYLSSPVERFLALLRAVSDRCAS
jgi:hypothetical protein